MSSSIPKVVKSCRASHSQPINIFKWSTDSPTKSQDDPRKTSSPYANNRQTRNYVCVNSIPSIPNEKTTYKFESSRPHESTLLCRLLFSLTSRLTAIKAFMMTRSCEFRAGIHKTKMLSTIGIAVALVDHGVAAFVDDCGFGTHLCEFAVFDRWVVLDGMDSGRC
jgi:hypothetical protein